MCAVVSPCVGGGRVLEQPQEAYAGSLGDDGSKAAGQRSWE